MPFDLIALDNAIVDLLVHADDALLDELKLEKGVCNLPDDAQLARIHARVRAMDPHVAPGGSAANMATLLSRLGAQVAFCSAVGNDAHGDLYERDLAGWGVTPYLSRAAGPTGIAATLITPDAQRTFAVHLGASLAMRASTLPRDAISGARVVYISGYLLEDTHLREAALFAMRIAKQAGHLVALDLSDPALMSRIGEDVRAILARKEADIVFANEAEARALTGEDAEGALAELSRHARIAIVKVGERGSLVREGERTVRVAAHKVAPVDTTGAGDAYAAGFLCALLKGLPVEKAGDLGSLLAAKVIAQVGARLQALPEEEIAAVLEG